MSTECYDSDLQPVTIELNVLYRVPEQSVVTIFRDYRGEAFDTLIAPRVQEALKEVAANRGAQMIVQQRREVKVSALAAAQRKIGTNLLEIVDLVLYDIRLPAAIEEAIENKMVQEQAAEKAKFTQQKTQIEADTEVIRARGESESIAIRGKALRTSADFVKLKVVEKWDGHSPLVVGAGGAELLLDAPNLQRRRAQISPSGQAGGGR
jgi:prohibitin 2